MPQKRSDATYGIGVMRFALNARLVKPLGAAVTNIAPHRDDRVTLVRERAHKMSR